MIICCSKTPFGSNAIAIHFFFCSLVMNGKRFISCEELQKLPIMARIYVVHIVIQLAIKKFSI